VSAVEPALPTRFTRKAALDALRALATQDGKLYVLVRRNRPLERALLQHFGSLQEAKRVADLPDAWLMKRKVRWSVATIVHELRRLQAARVRMTERALLAAGHDSLVGAIERFLGGLPEARRVAGVPEPPSRERKLTRWDVQRVVDEILELHASGAPLNSSKAPQALVVAAIRHCGSWQAAIEAAGFEYETVRGVRPPWTKAELRDELRRLARQHPEWTWAQLGNMSIGNSLARVFGSVEAGLRSAGLRDWPRRLVERRLSEREVIRRLRQLHAEGAAMNCDAVARSDRRLYYAATQSFASWDDAVRAAGLPTARKLRARRSREDVVDELLARFERGGDLTSGKLWAEDRSLHLAATRRFGNYQAALRAMQRARRSRTS